MFAGASTFYDSPEWLRLRYRVLKKQGGCCKLCGHRGSYQNPIQVDHIKPISTHPHLSLVERNLQVLCRRCNLGKSNTDSTDWRVSVRPSAELVANIQKKLARDKLGETH